AEEVRRVVTTYLIDEGLTAGWSLPRRRAGSITEAAARGESCGAEAAVPCVPARAPAGVAGATGPAEPTAAPAAHPLPVASGLGRLSVPRPRRSLLAHGLRVVSERRPGTGVVALELYVDAGTLREAKPGLAALTGRLLEEGTSRRTAEELAGAIEDVGGSLEVGATGGSVRVRAEDLALALELLAEVALQPAFPAEAIAQVARRVAAEVRGDLDDPAFRAELCFRALVYGAQPMGRDPRGSAREIARLTRPE